MKVISALPLLSARAQVRILNVTRYRFPKQLIINLIILIYRALNNCTVTGFGTDHLYYGHIMANYDDETYNVRS